jgi:hypothetical protein
MTKRDHQANLRAAAQLPMAFATRQALDLKRRADAIALLSGLLLQVARAEGEREVHDDAS